MAYINNTKFTELRKNASEGDEKALNILNIFKKGGNQEELEGMINDYYTPESEPIPDMLAGPEPSEEEEGATTLYSCVGKVAEELQKLVAQYGKKNVLAAIKLIEADIKNSPLETVEE